MSPPWLRAGGLGRNGTERSFSRPGALRRTSASRGARPDAAACGKRRTAMPRDGDCRRLHPPAGSPAMPRLRADLRRCGGAASPGRRLAPRSLPWSGAGPARGSSPCPMHGQKPVRHLAAIGPDSRRWRVECGPAPALPGPETHGSSAGAKDREPPKKEESRRRGRGGAMLEAKAGRPQNKDPR